jgi:competence protein ComEA
MLKSINDYFYFNQRERRGIFVLLSIITVLVGSNIFIIPQFGKNEPINKDAFIAWVDSLMQKPNEKIDTTIIEYFNFDPNQITMEDWLKLGLTEKQTQTILNYRNAGGKFFTKKDLKKIYSISDELFQKLEPYILLPDSKTSNSSKYSIINKDQRDWSCICLTDH